MLTLNFESMRDRLWIVFLLALLVPGRSALGQTRVGVADSVLLAGLVQLEYGAVLPLADLSDRFGLHNDIGLQISIKNRKNLLLGAGMQFYFGSSVREDSILKPIQNEAGFIIGTDGFQYTPNLSMRGWSLSAHAGKVTGLGAVNPNSGVVLIGAAGFIQHRIDLNFEKEFLPQLLGDYEKGYDRLANGLFLRQYIGYIYSGSERFLNLRVGMEWTESFTAPRRDANLDTGEIPSGNRLDIQAALKVAWVLPIYENPKLQYYYY
jgi:hypothetical protein